MRKIVLAAVLVLSSLGIASAAGVQFDVGSGGVYVGPNHHRYDHDWRWRHRHETYGYAGDCRTVIKHFWRHGERVTVRRHVCD